MCPGKSQVILLRFQESFVFILIVMSLLARLMTVLPVRGFGCCGGGVEGEDVVVLLRERLWWSC